MELAKYKCHKVVEAGKIEKTDINTEGNHILILEGIEEPVIVSDSYMHKHLPREGGYYVLYEDGYESFSPARAFESGYTKVEEKP
jgi:hypothetical protein